MSKLFQTRYTHIRYFCDCKDWLSPIPQSGIVNLKKYFCVNCNKILESFFEPFIFRNIEKAEVKKWTKEIKVAKEHNKKNSTYWDKNDYKNGVWKCKKHKSSGNTKDGCVFCEEEKDKDHWNCPNCINRVIYNNYCGNCGVPRPTTSPKKLL